MNAGNVGGAPDISGPNRSHRYLLPAVIRWTGELSEGRPLRILDIGCGSGYIAAELARRGHSVLGIDPDAERIRRACTAYPGVRFEIRSVYEQNLHEVVRERPDCIVSLPIGRRGLSGERRGM